jgi:hypothetical protein
MGSKYTSKKECMLLDGVTIKALDVFIERFTLPMHVCND